MKNSKLRRALLLLACAVMLVSLSVGATLAYLTNQTGTVTNTFTVGKVKIDLDEALVDLYGVPQKEEKTTVDGEEVTKLVPVTKPEDAKRVTENTYKLIPGHAYTKDPTVYIADDSESCWLFVKVVNEISAIEQGYDDIQAISIKEQMIGIEGMEEGKWAVVDETNGIYAYKKIVNPGDKIVVFNNFYIKSNADVSAYEGKTITVQAYAIQADTLDTYEAAWVANGSTWPAN